MTKQDMIKQAKVLFEGNTEDSNPEYLRGMSELIAYCFGKTYTDSAITADQIKTEILKG